MLSPWETAQLRAEAIPAFEGGGAGWSSFGSGNEVCAFRKDQFGRVWIKGLVTSDTHTTGTANRVFTLPVGFRPVESVTFASSGNGKHAELTVNTSGQVFCGAADSATYGDYLSVACSFMTTKVSTTTI